MADFAAALDRWLSGAEGTSSRDLEGGTRTVRVGRTAVEMVPVAAGKFMMGSEDQQNEQPRRLVRITKPFLIGAYAVTQALYETLVGHRPLSVFWGCDEFPVDSVSWFDAITFCNLLSASERLDPYYEIGTEGKVGRLGGQGYRLPTEAEWEYACRAGSGALYCFGDDTAELTRYAWFDQNSEKSLHKVGTLMPNAFGLYDMHGNVWEWCWDWYGRYSDAGGDADPVGPATGSERILRGGSWNSVEEWLRSSSRNGFDPQSGLYYFGFRVARDVLT
jgi:formylglycine-generating enzyme required for sulfatase activity